MTFRTRLLLAILGVVVFTTAVSLLVAQRQHGSAYRTLGDELLSNQEAWFQRLQSGRQQQAAAMVGRLAGSVPLTARSSGWRSPTPWRIPAQGRSCSAGPRLRRL